MSKQKTVDSIEASRKMGRWKFKTISKKNKGSQTTGRQKGIASSALERYACRHNRSWKHPNYSAIMAPLTGEKRRGKK